MKNIIENPQNISELSKAKVKSFQIEELHARLEMNPWLNYPEPNGPTFPTRPHIPLA